jgi:hypothetical protein
MTRGQPVRWLEGVIHDVLTAVEAETGGGGDDIKLFLAGGLRVEVQVKKGLRATQELWTALLAIAEAINSEDGVYGLLLISPTSSGTVRDTLARDIAVIGDGRTDELSQIGHTWLSRLKAANLDAEYVCSRLRIQTVAALAFDQSAIQAARAELGHLCANPAEIEAAWLAIYKDADRLIELRGRRDRESAERVLRAIPIALVTQPASIGAPWQRRLVDADASSGSVLGILATVPVAQKQSPNSDLGRSLLDAEAIKRGERIRRGRYFEGFPTQAEASRLAAQLLQGEFEQCSDNVRAQLLANCARWLSLKGEQYDVVAILEASAQLADTEESVIAAAFLASKENWKAGLRTLEPITTPGRRAAAFQIVVNSRSPKDALGWFSQSGIAPTDLHSDGRNTLLSVLLLADEWEQAYQEAIAIPAEDFVRTPALQPAAALARIGQVVAPDLRRLVANGTPLDAATFRMADDASALEERRVASCLLRGAAQSALEFGNHRLARSYATTALWLELRDPRTSVAARAELEEHLASEQEAIAFLPLAVAFEIEIRHEAIEQALGRRSAIEPDGSVELALARLAVANSMDTADRAAEYFAEHREMMWAHLAKPGILEIEIRLLVAAGRIEAARERLAQDESVLEPLARGRLRELIERGPAGLATKDFEDAFADNPTTINLSQLVSHLAEQGYSARFFELARTLIRSTRTRLDAENLVRFLLRHDRHDEVSIVLAEIPEIIDSSPDLRSALAWSAFRDGNIDEATRILATLSAERDDTNDRNLLVNILITSGRWPELTGFVEQEWAERDRRTAQELLGAAQIAQQVRSPRLVELLRLAAERGVDDPRILLGCFMLATKAGREEELDAYSWFDRACRTSGEDGPVQEGSLEEVAEQAPVWDRHIEDIWERIRLSEAPVSVGAEMMRRPSLELVLAPMIANPEEPDPRRRAVISAFSGTRGLPEKLESGPIALDGSALITFAMLGRLPTILFRPGGVVVPHTALSWLFTERQELPFHQPSRIKAAHALLRLLTANRIHRFSPSVAVDAGLGDQVGRTLAAMIAEARNGAGSAPPRYVIRSAPVDKVGSFRGQSVDMTSHETVLRSCQAVLEKVVEKGLLTQAEESRARGYLERSEQRWPDEGSLEDGADIFLDDLSVSYLRTTGLLQKLDAAGLRAFVSEREINEAQTLVDIESREEAIETAIETVRTNLAEAITVGAAHLDRLFSDEDLKSHPNIAVIQLATRAKAIVSDDRYLNQHRNIDHAGSSAPIWTSLDLLRAMNAAGELTDDELWRDRTLLRQYGYVLIPSDARELKALISRSRDEDGVLVETAELKAFRQNLKLAQLRGWLKLPHESAWLNKLVSDVVATIRDQWRDDVDDPTARARSRWLLRCADIRNWAGAITDYDSANMARYGLAVTLNSLLMNRVDVSSTKALKRMDEWLENEILAQLKIEEPSIYDWLINNLRVILADRMPGSGRAD